MVDICVVLRNIVGGHAIATYSATTSPRYYDGHFVPAGDFGHPVLTVDKASCTFTRAHDEITKFDLADALSIVSNAPAAYARGAHFLQTEYYLRWFQNKYLCAHYAHRAFLTIAFEL